MGWANVITGAAGIYGASQQKKGADAQADAANEGLDFTKQVYADSQGNFQPYLQAGQYGLNGMTSFLGGDASGFKASPYYNLGMEEAQYGIDHGAASRGSLYSGGHSLDLAKGLNNVFMNNVGAYTSGLQNLANSGQNAAGTLGGIGSQTTQMVNQGLNNVGNANASSYQANADLGFGLGGLANNWYQGKYPGSY